MSADEAAAEPKLAGWERVERVLMGPPRDLHDPSLGHKLSLVAFLAWVGLGADGLSSSAYGPEEAFKALGTHTYLALGLALATAFTVILISVAYSRVIEHFPFGGGGYIVATRLLGDHAGLLSGSALLVDYVLTISVSIASGADTVFSALPAWAIPFKFATEIGLTVLLTVLNLRGVRESVTALVPIFLVFVGTHLILITVGVAVHLRDVGNLWSQMQLQLDCDLGRSTAGCFTPDGVPRSGLGLLAMVALLMRAYSLGGGTYTGIEAVSNGLPIMREPRVQTGKRTMVYMAVSLAFTAGGIILCYLLWNIHPVQDKTMNAVLVEKVTENWTLGGVHLGGAFVLTTLVGAGLVLLVAAQAGFIDGPRVMANMATGSWMPRRFLAFSDRLTMQNGVLLMGGAAVATLLYTGGQVGQLVVMYSINVFLTFSLTQLGMTRYWFSLRAQRPDWSRQIVVHLVGFLACATILVITVVEKFSEGGWMTVIITSALVVLCIRIRRHYQRVAAKLSRVDEILTSIPQLHRDDPPLPINPKQATAVLCVGGYSGLGVHALLNVQRVFPGHFQNFIFVGAAVIDSASFHGVDEVERVEAQTRDALDRYVRFTQGLGVPSRSYMSAGTDAVDVLEGLCMKIGEEYPRAVFFSGQLIFEKPKWTDVIFHNQTATALQRRIQFRGKQMVILPVRVIGQVD